MNNGYEANNKIAHGTLHFTGCISDYVDEYIVKEQKRIDDLARLVYISLHHTLHTLHACCNIQCKVTLSTVSSKFQLTNERINL